MQARDKKKKGIEIVRPHNLIIFDVTLLDGSWGMTGSKVMLS